jgi:hypothetical protein
MVAHNKKIDEENRKREGLEEQLLEDHAQLLQMYDS